MLVVFVSQCEKKSHKRTREVLDAFANRIGDNTWQTAITEEGLNTIKRLLRKTASKSTAVSCHRVCTRNRMNLLWIVGNKEKFDANGVVAVNWTEMDLIKFQDKEKNIMINLNIQNIYANTHKQLLSEHSFAVGLLAYQILKKLGINKDKLLDATFIAGILHDIGKVDPFFQNWINKSNENKDDNLCNRGDFSFEKYPRHQEISFLFASELLNNTNLNDTQIEQILHVVYWHHSIPFRKDKNNNKYFEDTKGLKLLLQDNKNFKQIENNISHLLSDIFLIAKNYNFNIENYKFNAEFNFKNNENVPKYKNYDERIRDCDGIIPQIKNNSLNNIMRSAVISADRLVSALSHEDLSEYIQEQNLEQILDNIEIDDSTLSVEIEQCLAEFQRKYPQSERNIHQSKIAQKLVDLNEIAKFEGTHNIGVLQGPAGCGKTKISLEWALKTNAKKIIWVCPRVQVALGLINDLTQNEYLPNTKIEIFTGEYKKIITQGQNFFDIPDTEEHDYFSGDIVITTIDQIINNVISHSKITSMLTYMQSHIVIDEFHELITIPALNLLFAEIIEAKKLMNIKANTLLVSATPNDYFVENVLNIKQEHIIRAKTFNTSKYRLEFETYNDESQNPLITKTITGDQTTFIITNTAKDAQLGFLLHQKDENNVLIHSKYTNEHKKIWFDEVFNSFKKNGNGKYKILRSGPIVQASLNITCDRMFTDLTNAENYLQRLGRLDRFGESSAINVYTTIFPGSITNNKQSSNQAKFLNKLMIWNSSLAWKDFLQCKLKDNELITLTELYKIYSDFYQDPSAQAKISEDTMSTIKNSIAIINKKIQDPLVFPPKNKRTNITKISNKSLRGDNRFVQMAVCLIDENLKSTILNEYAYDEEIDHSTNSIGLTESVDKIQGYGDSERNLLSFMQRKHHNIKGVKKTYKDFILLNEARFPENPIYVSYIPDDLQKIGGETNKYAIYYAKTARQEVGSICLEDLNN